jgi:hypothetical protein
MTVGELIEALQALDPAHLVVMSCDAEGNRYAPLRVVDACHYTAERANCGEIDDADELLPDGPNAVALWP